MPAKREGLLEKCIDEATRKHDFQGLEQFLETDFSDGISHKCSKQFLNKLDKLIHEELVNEEIKNVSTLLNTLQKHGRNINILGEVGFPAMIEHGLVQKAKGILENKENEKNDKFTILFEDFFDVLMTVHNSSSEGKIQILENFVWRTCSLAADKRINIYIQQEAVRKLNTMLDAIPRDIRRKIISTKEMLHAMNDMGKRILDAGDYDLQVAITEALCRMTSEKQRGELASQWFSMEFVTNAFKGIKDSEFETDCRKFLNQVNGMLGDKRRVFTYPCLSAILDKDELQIPADDNLEEFWIDFNTGSRSISFYVAADEEGHQWETVCIPEEEVETYIIEEKDKNKLLTIHLCNPISVGVQEGDKIILHFDSALEILDAVRKVYGAVKCQSFTKKNTMSVAKTTVHVIFDESGSQVIVPESQMSPLKEKVVGKGSCSLRQYSRVQTDLIQKTSKEDFQTVQSKITPCKRKMSEASMIVPSASRWSMQSSLPLVNTSTPRKCRVKTPLQMMNSVERNCIFSVPERIMNFSLEDNVPVCSTKSLKKNNSAEKQVPVENVINMHHGEEDADTKRKEQRGELIDIVPDSQPVNNNDKQLLPGMEENSAAEIKTQKRQMCWVPETIISHCNKHNISPQETSNISDRVAKQKAFSSIFEMSSTEVKSKLHCNGEIVEQQHNENNKIPVEGGKINSVQSRNIFKPLDEKMSKSSRKKLASSKPEAPVTATQMNDSSLIHLGYSKSVTAISDDTGFDVDSRKKTAKKKTKKVKSKAMAEAAELLISNISDRYKQKDEAQSTRELHQSFSKRSTSLNKSGFSISKKKNQNSSSGDLKTTTLLNITTKHLMDDVYNFNISGFDEPTIKLGIQEFHLTKLEATTDLSKKMNHENQGKNTSRKKQYNKNRTNKNKKHLFSDTDTEYRGDDTKTDISWLRESSRKPKPHLIDYSRMRKQKKSKVTEAKKTSPSTSVNRTFQQMEIINDMAPISKNLSDSEGGKQAQPTRLKQQRRAALAKKSYKELSDSESDSEEESSEHLIKRGTLKGYPEPKSIKKKAVNQSKAQQSIVSSKTTKGSLVNQHKRFTKSKDSGPKNQMELSSLPSFESPASLEIMRCCEKYGEEQSTEEHTSLGRSSLSSLLTPEKELISEKEKSLGDIKNVSGITEINTESIQLKQLSEKGRNLVFGTEDLSPVSSSFSLPNLSPLTTRKKITSNQDADITKLQKKIYDVDEAVSIKHHPLNKSPHTELKGFSENLMKNRGEAYLSVSQPSTPSKSKEELCHEEPLAHIHESGPTVHTNFKRLYQEDTEADSDEEIRRKETKTKLLPRKLFKTDDNTYKVSESISTLSINDTSVFDGEGWDADTSSVGMICQKVHKELARKIQSRTKRIDSFTKQSLKTVHQYMNTMNSELHKHRAKQLENLHSCLIKEIESFERDSQALRNMEKEFSNFSKKQTETFSTYNKNEQQRLQNLKISFEKNVCNMVDCEEKSVTSEMHQMKADMKGIQERFLKEMHEEELLNVRKGLQSLFMDENRNF